MPSPPEHSAAQTLVTPQSQTQVFPGAWPLEDISISPESQRQSTPHLDRVLSFHKRFSWSFSSPILMPARSPLLSPSISEPSGLVVGQDCDTSATSLSVLADESISTAYSTDSAQETASHHPIASRLSESTSFPYSPDTTAVYASPEVNHNYVVFPADYKSYDSSCKPLNTRVTHISQPCSPPGPMIPFPNRPANLNTEIPTSASSLALSLTPPSPGPIIFAAPSNSSFLLLTPSNSSFSVAALGNRDGTSPVRPHSLSLPLRLVPVQIDSNSTVESESAPMSAISRSVSPLPTTSVPPRRPWRDFAKENSSSRSSFAGRGQSGLLPSSTDAQPNSSNRASSSRTLLLAIETNPLTSTQKTRTHPLSLARPPHTRAFSSTSIVTKTASPGPSRTLSLRRSSPQLTTQPSFPSRSTSPSPLHHRVSEKFNPTRSHSTALFRSVSDRSKARFSRSFRTTNDSTNVADYAAAQCEATFISDALHPTAEEDSLDGTNDPTEGVLVNYYVPDSDNNGSVRHSTVTKWKKFGGKVKNFVRVVQRSIALHRKPKCINLAQSDGALIKTTLQCRVDPALAIQDPQPQPGSPQLPSLLKISEVQSAISGPPDYRSVAPIVHGSAPTPTSLTRHEVSGPTSARPSPTLTLRVEPKARSVPKDDMVGSSPAGSHLKRMEGHSASDGEPSTSQEKSNDPPVIFAGIANFGGNIGFDW